MGGCRCTYRNCTVKSDGKTHMFHYPVFEKIRCHQWLINAHRLEFLDLKVSQLKNRVVCQHHFRDENFMNFKKDKLTFDAIPTEDGPYCDTANYVYVNPDTSKLFPIIIEDIENDYNDKKTIFSMKYGDFLANLDLMDIEKIDEDSLSYKKTCNSNTVINNNSLDMLSPNKGRDKSRLFCEDNSFLFNISLPDKSKRKSITHPTLAVSPYVSGTDVIINNAQSYLHPKSKDKNISADTKHSILLGNEARNIKCIQPKQELKKEPKVKILSEKKVIDPVPITGKFEPVSPNFVLNVSKKRKVSSQSMHNSSSSKSIENNESGMQETNKIIEIEAAPVIKEEDYPKQQPHIASISLLQNSFEPEKSPKVIKPQPLITSVNVLRNNLESEKSPQVIKPHPYIASVNVLRNSFETEKSPKVLKPQSYQTSVNLLQTSYEADKCPKVSKPQQFISSVNVIQNTSKSEKSPKTSKLQQHISSINSLQNLYDTEKSPKMSIIKPRVPPERVEAINKKREFNMKLRDMVESCLDKLDNCEKPHEQSSPKVNAKGKLNKIKVHRITSIPKNTPILSSQEYTIAFLEARMRKMENTLLEKIDQNSTKINDLKNTFLKTPAQNQFVAQTKADEEAHKKYLFQEIAKYLSPCSKSLVYEELFINKFALHEPTTSSNHKRRRRK